MQLTLTQETILLLDSAQEERQLLPHELNLWKSLKSRVLGLAVIERIRIKQRSHVNWLCLGDANSKFFHIKANGRRRRNCISSISDGQRVAVEHDQKEGIIWRFFQGLLGAPSDAAHSFDWAALGLPQVDLEGLDAPFSEEEVWQAISDSTLGHAPGPDGLSGSFFRAVWPAIKGDVLRAFGQLFFGNSSALESVNTSTIVLLAKRADASEVRDYRPISLMHSVAKLFMKVLASRLAKKIDLLVSASQCAFIKGRCIQDNFLFVQNLLKDLHRKKKAGCAPQARHS